ncbi:MAG TPA: VWA domain-containing protein [Gaiellaceae bacterium]|nr:VWA domain-containing protein [Gaiellaceae bacterium]
MSFAAPAALVLLLAIPLAAYGWVWLHRLRAERAAAWASPALLPNMISSPPRWRTTLPAALLLCGVALLLVGFARPQASVTVKNNNATLILVLDVSGSMAATDAPPSRFAQARFLAARFANSVPKGYRVAVVTFSDHAAVVAPPTTDIARVERAIKQTKVGPQGTAIGDAIWHAVDVAHAVPKANGKFPPAAIVLFSDGGSSAGRVTEQQAMTKAHDSHVPVNVVALGTPNGIVKQPLKGGFTEQIQVPADVPTLQAYAHASNGRFFAGAAAVNVKAVDNSLATRAGHKKKKVEVTAAAAGGGIAFIVFGAALSGLWFRRLV